MFMCLPAGCFRQSFSFFTDNARARLPKVCRNRGVLKSVRVSTQWSDTRKFVASVGADKDLHPMWRQNYEKNTTEQK